MRESPTQGALRVQRDGAIDAMHEAHRQLTEANRRIDAVREQAKKWATDGRATSPDGLVYYHAGKAILALLDVPE